MNFTSTTTALDAPTDLTRRVHTAVRHASPRVAEAMRTLLWRLAAHPGQALAGRWYTELSVSYLHKVADCAYETAREAWRRIRRILRWQPVHPQAVRNMGGTLRNRHGRTWGQHLLLSPDVREAVTAWLASEPTYQDRTSTWVEVQPIPRGSTLTCRCPWHDDHKPSMVMYPNDDGVSGSAVCFACVDEKGDRRTGYWRVQRGQYSMRMSAGSGQHTGPRTGQAIPTNTLRLCTVLKRELRPSEHGHLLCRLGGSGLVQTRSKSVSLLDVLRHAERSTGGPAGEAALWKGVTDWDRRGGDHRDWLPELYASLDSMRVTRWRKVCMRDREFYKPTKWEPVEARWIACDLDGFTDAPTGDQGLVRVGEDLAAWAREHEALSGEVAIVRTSHLGVQAIVGLAQARTLPRRWRRSTEARDLAGELDRRALDGTHAVGFVGGHADQTVHGAGRLIRRPGPRVDKHGLPYRSRLVWSCDQALTGSPQRTPAQTQLV